VRIFVPAAAAALLAGVSHVFSAWADPDRWSRRKQFLSVFDRQWMALECQQRQVWAKVLGMRSHWDGAGLGGRSRQKYLVILKQACLTQKESGLARHPWTNLTDDEAPACHLRYRSYQSCWNRRMFREQAWVKALDCC
jgi:hypothetical protein